MDDKINHLIQVQDSVLRGVNQLAAAFISDPKVGEFARKIQPIGSMLSAKLDNGSLANSLSRMLTPPANNGRGNSAAPANNGRGNSAAPANNGTGNSAAPANNGTGNYAPPANNGNTDYSGTGGRRKTMNRKNKKKKRSRRSKH